MILGISPAISKQFSVDVRWAFGRANAIAEESNAEYITSAHLLAAITDHPDAAALLGTTDPSALKADAIHATTNRSAQEDLKRVLEWSIAYAKRDGEHSVTLDHVVSALLECPNLLAHKLMARRAAHGRAPH